MATPTIRILAKAGTAPTETANPDFIGPPRSEAVLVCRLRSGRLPSAALVGPRRAVRNSRDADALLRPPRLAVPSLNPASFPMGDIGYAKQARQLTEVLDRLKKDKPQPSDSVPVSGADTQAVEARSTFGNNPTLPAPGSHPDESLMATKLTPGETPTVRGCPADMFWHYQDGHGIPQCPFSGARLLGQATDERRT